MEPITLLGIIVGIPIVLILLLRSNGAIVFLSLCAGSVLVRYVGSDALNVVSGRVSENNLPSIVQIGLLLLPALLSLLLLRKSVPSSKLIFNALAAVAVGLVTAILLVPLLPGGVQANITNNSLWAKSGQYQSGIIAAGSLIALITLWLTHHGKGRHHHKKHK
jgi:hypothetical protein